MRPNTPAQALPLLQRRLFMRSAGLSMALALPIAWPRLARADVPDAAARELMERNFFATKLEAVRTKATMRLVTDQGQTRERRMDAAQRLQPNGIDSKLVIRFGAPTDIRGVGFLQVEHADADDDQWIYLPALKKSRRLVANNKKESFMGSDFSYGDFARPKVDTYVHRLLRAEAVEGRPCRVIESVPKDPKTAQDQGYSRKLTWVRDDSFLEARIEYYDLGGALLKTQNAREHRLIEPARGRWLALQRDVLNHQTGHRTELLINDIATSPVPGDDYFNTRTLEREA